MQKRYLIILILIIVTCCQLYCQQDITVGLIKHSTGSTDNGYILFAPMCDSTTYLIDKCGYCVHKWSGNYLPGLSVYLLPNGKLLKTGMDKASHFRSGGGGGYIEIINWDGTVEWTYKLSTETECQHHDVKYLPNGNILAIVYDLKNLDEIQTAGKNPVSFDNEFWSEKIIELRPIGKDSAEIVWEWKIWDHLVQDFDSTRQNYGTVAKHPELIDVNFGSNTQRIDWHHMNSIDYNPELDQILVSSCFFSEVWIIDHSTTTVEAASHKDGKYGKGGDLLWRWGNPIAYQNGTGDNQKLFNQHDASWIPKGLPLEGSIMIFNNLNGTPNEKYSSVDIIKPPVNSEGFYDNELPYAPENNEWSYTAPKKTDLLAVILSSAQMMKNGNVLICDGPKGNFFEIDTLKNIVWDYLNPVTNTGILKQGQTPMLTSNSFRCLFYPEDYSGFDGKDLSQKGTIENENENSDNCSGYSVVKAPELVYPANNANDCLLSEQFKWRKVANAQSYYIQVAKDTAFTSMFFEGTAGADTLKLISNMLAETDYYWHVASVTSEGMSPYSANWKLSTSYKPIVLQAPSNLKVNVPLDTKFTWLPNTAGTQYQIQISKVADFKSTVADEKVSNKTEFQTTVLEPYQSYYWRVRLVVGTSFGLWSDVWSLKTVVKSPELISPANNDVDQSLTLISKWRRVTGAQSYYIQIAEDAEFTSMFFEGNVGADTLKLISNMLAQTEYFWHVAAVTTEGTGAYSPAWKFKTAISPVVLQAPINAKVNLPLETKFTWVAHSGGNQYQIQISKVVDFQTTVVDEKINNKLVFQTTVLDYYQTYYWRVRLVLDQSFGQWSDTWSFKTGIKTANLLLPVDKSIEQPIALTLKWSAVAGAAYYDLQVSKNEQFTDLVFEADSITKSEQYIEGLQPKVKYFWRINDWNLESFEIPQWSPIWSFTTAQVSIVLSNPVNGSANLKLPIELSWFPAATAEYYHLQLSNDANFANIILDKNSIYDTKYSLSEADITVGMQYFWHIKGVNSQNNIPWSDSWQFTTNTVYVEESEQFTEIKLYPNPSESILNIKTSIMDFFIEVYDIKGEKRITKENTSSINVDGLENGVYYIKLIPKSELSSKIYKFIIWR